MIVDDKDRFQCNSPAGSREPEGAHTIFTMVVRAL